MATRLEKIKSLSDEEKIALVEKIGIDKFKAIINDPSSSLRPKQKMRWDLSWRYRMMYGSRSIGKNFAGRAAIYEAVVRQGYKHLAIIVQTYDDIGRNIVGGPTSMLDLPCKVEFKGKPPTLYFPEYDATVLIYSAKNPDSIRGLSAGFAWCDERAAWYEPKRSNDGSPVMNAWNILEFAIREGNPNIRSRFLVTTTPRGTKWMRDMVKNPDCLATHETMYENKKNLDPMYIKSMEDIYLDTRIGRQELLGEILDDVEGALWKQELIDNAKINVKDLSPAKWRAACSRIVVAVDPAMREGFENDATAIVVAGKIQNKAYILDSVNIRAQPPVWAKKVKAMKDKWQASTVFIEDNQGGDSMKYILNQAGIHNVEQIRAIKDKETRAAPVHALYEQQRVKHVNDHIALEDELSYFPIGGPDTHDDLVDALVYSVSELLVNDRQTKFLGRL